MLEFPSILILLLFMIATLAVIIYGRKQNHKNTSTITVNLYDGTPFQGSDTIRVIMPMPRGLYKIYQSNPYFF